MRGVDTCYLCGRKLEDRFNVFDASGILTHKVCPMKRFRFTGKTRSGDKLHLWGAGRTPCGRDARKTGHSLAGVDCEQCKHASRVEFLAARRAG